MNTHRPIVFLIVLTLATCAVQAEDGQRRTRILFFTKSQRTEHAVIKRGAGDQLSLAEKVLGELAAVNRWDVVATKDGTMFTADGLAKYNALLLYTNGTLTEAGVDGSPPMTQAGKAALIEAVRNGKPLVAVHTALTTFN